MGVWEFHRLDMFWSLAAASHAASRWNHTRTLIMSSSELIIQP